MGEILGFLVLLIIFLLLYIKLSLSYLCHFSVVDCVEMFCQSLTRYACEVLPYRSHMAAKKLRKTDLQQKVHTEQELEQQQQQFKQQQQHYQEQLDFNEFSAALGGDEGLQNTLSSKSGPRKSAITTDAGAAAGSAALTETDEDEDDDKIAAPSQQEAVDCMRRVLGLAEILGMSKRVCVGC